MGAKQSTFGRLLSVNLRDRIRRWWKPAQYAEDHPISEEEREALQQLPSYTKERAKLDGYTAGGPPINVDDEFRRR